MSDNAAKWYLRTQDETFGPETEEQLVAWARMGRIQPGQELSDDNIVWRRVEDVPFLDMRFSIDLGDGNPKGPFNKAAADALIASGRLPKSASIVEVRAPFDNPSPDPQPQPQPPPQPKVVVKEVRVEVPVEVEKVVVDETRVKELEGLLAAAERRVEDAKREAAKLSEQVTALEDELRRLPQAASEVADIQAAMFAAMTSEAEELQKMLEEEKREADDFRKRHQERADRLLERRRNLLKRSGSNIEEMTRRALIERPEDPRTAQYRKELEELRRLCERKAFDYEDKIRDLESKLKVRETEMARAKSAMKDITQLQAEAQSLREQLQIREKELITERQKNEERRQQQAFAQQAMMARLASLESPSIGTAQSMSTNQSREAKLVKLPRWMQLGK